MNGKRETCNTKAYATVILNDVLRVDGIRVIDGAHGLFVSFPRVKLSSGKFHDLVAPVDQENRKHVQEQILNSFHTEMIAKTA
jgi:DNA-binding cell septation regulator SpoVG